MTVLLKTNYEFENAFQQDVIKFARMREWLVYHTVNSRYSRPGFPDLVLVRDRVVFAELKINKGKATKLQQEWLDRLTDANAECYIWRPQDATEIERTLW